MPTFLPSHTERLGVREASSSTPYFLGGRRRYAKVRLIVDFLGLLHNNSSPPPSTVVRREGALEDTYFASLYMYVFSSPRLFPITPCLRYGTTSRRIPISDSSRGTV